MTEEEQTTKLPTIQRQLTLKDLDEYRKGNLYSAFGYMHLSTKPTGGKAVFGKAPR